MQEASSQHLGHLLSEFERHNDRISKWSSWSWSVNWFIALLVKMQTKQHVWPLVRFVLQINQGYTSRFSTFYIFTLQNVLK